MAKVSVGDISFFSEESYLKYPPNGSSEIRELLHPETKTLLDTLTSISPPLREARYGCRKSNRIQTARG